MDNSLEEMKTVPIKTLDSYLRRTRERPKAIITDGIATNSLIREAESLGVKVIVAKNFTSTDTRIELMSF